ncbi:NAD-P-binding protein [Trametes sanguinea]|nr:NAD-P-binding protein [Trametes sanguinea]
MSPRIWLITGTSTGMGRSLAEFLLEKGEIVVATLRSPEVIDDLKSKYPSERLAVHKLDVTKEDQIVDVFAFVKERFGRLDVVVNNAGYAMAGELEATKEADARAIFETNFWGAVHVTREAVKFFREVNPAGVGGRLLQISSQAGVAVAPATGYYSATKFALEAISEALAAELDPAWNIKVTVIELGGFRTPGVEKIIWASPHPAYNKPDLPSNLFRKSGLNANGDPKKAANAYYELVALQDPPLHLPLGKECISVIRKKLTDFSAMVDEYAYLSADLEVDLQEMVF